MPFIPGESYTREHIQAELGGEMVSYLPQRDGRVVCGGCNRATAIDYATFLDLFFPVLR
jgi:hypothetical protein